MRSRAGRANRRLVDTQLLWRNAEATFEHTGGFNPALMWFFAGDSDLTKVDGSGGVQILPELFGTAIDNKFKLDHCEIEMVGEILDVNPGPSMDSPWVLDLDYVGEAMAGNARSVLGDPVPTDGPFVNRHSKWNMTASGYRCRAPATNQPPTEFGYCFTNGLFDKNVNNLGPALTLATATVTSIVGFKFHLQYPVGLANAGDLGISLLRRITPLMALRFNSQDPPFTDRLVMDISIYAYLYKAVR